LKSEAPTTSSGLAELKHLKEDCGQICRQARVGLEFENREEEHFF
jgi:hypothetical protein